MTAPIETDEIATTETNPQDEEASTDPDKSEGRKPPREQRYRIERNQAREALTAAEARIQAMQTRELHRLVADTLAQPEDITLSGLELSDFIGEDGELDTEAIAEAAASLVESRPGLALNPRVGATDPSQGQGGRPGKSAPSWGDLLRV